MRFPLFSLTLPFLCTALTVAVAAEDKPTTVRVLIQTEKGDIEVELDAAKAPNTTANFLKYVDSKFYDDGRVHRTGRADNQPDDKVKIGVIQAGINPAKMKEELPPIKILKIVRKQ